MRRSTSAWTTAILGTALAASTLSAREVAPTGGGREGLDPSTASAGRAVVAPALIARGPRALIRKGWDSIANQDYDQALACFRAAEKQSDGLTAADRLNLKKGVESARRSLRSVANGTALVADHKAAGGKTSDRDPIQLASRTQPEPETPALPVLTLEPDPGPDPGRVVAPEPRPETGAAPVVSLPPAPVIPEAPATGDLALPPLPDMPRLPAVPPVGPPVEAGPVVAAPAPAPTPVPEPLPPLPETPPPAAAPVTPAPRPEPVSPLEEPLAAPIPAPAPTPPAPILAPAPRAARPASSDSLIPRRALEDIPSTLSPELQRQVEQIAQKNDEEMNRRSEVPPRETTPGQEGTLGAPATRLEITRAPSPTEARPIRAIPVPEEFVALTPRDWSPNRKYWSAAATCHMPLYFQDAALERYGHSVERFLGPAGSHLSYPLDNPRQSTQRNQLAQPFFSIGLFAFQVAALPYNLIMDPPWETEYDLGYYRPGDKVPTDLYYLPMTGIGPPLHGRKY